MSRITPMVLRRETTSVAIVAIQDMATRKPSRERMGLHEYGRGVCWGSICSCSDVWFVDGSWLYDLGRVVIMRRVRQMKENRREIRDGRMKLRGFSDVSTVIQAIKVKNKGPVNSWIEISQRFQSFAGSMGSIAGGGGAAGSSESQRGLL